jgi:hypothetical protein
VIFPLGETRKRRFGVTASEYVPAGPSTFHFLSIVSVMLILFVMTAPTDFGLQIGYKFLS